MHPPGARECRHRRARRRCRMLSALSRHPAGDELRHRSGHVLPAGAAAVRPFAVIGHGWRHARHDGLLLGHAPTRDRRAGGSAETREHARARGLRVHAVRDDVRHTAGSARIYLRWLVGGGVALQRQPGRGRPVGDGHAAWPRSPQRGSALRRAACERRAGHGTLQLRHPYPDRTGPAGAVPRSDRGCIVELVSPALAPRSPRLASYFPLGRAPARGGPVPEPVRMAVSRCCGGRLRAGRALRAPARALRGVSRLGRGSWRSAGTWKPAPA